MWIFLKCRPQRYLVLPPNRVAITVGWQRFRLPGSDWTFGTRPGQRIFNWAVGHLTMVILFGYDLWGSRKLDLMEAHYVGPGRRT